MNQRLQTLLDYVVARLQELSTWQGINAALTLIGVSLRPDKAQTLGMVGVGVFAALAAVFPDKFKS